jgi:formate-dependent nitrite reductase membrane component NrfD
MAVGYKFQTQWIKGRGKLLLLAMYTGGIGGSLFIISSLYNYVPGIILGFLILVIGKPLFHLIFLGRPERFIYAFKNIRGSWISRGIIGITIYAFIGGGYIYPYLDINIYNLINPILWQVLRYGSVGIALFLVMYDGFLISYTKAIPFWNIQTMKIIFPLTSFIGGLALNLFLLNWIETVVIHDFELYEIILLTLGSLVISIHIYLAKSRDKISNISALELIKGRYMYLFWIGILLGIIFPLFTASIILSDILVVKEIGRSMIGLSSTLELIGDFIIKFSLFSVGIYRSLVDDWSTPSIYQDTL